MCEYLSFVSDWQDGQGLQVYADPSLRGHSRAVQLYKLPDDCRRWSWERDGEENLVLSHGQTMTPERNVERTEILRLWPDRITLATYLLGRAVASLDISDLDLSGTQITAVPRHLKEKIIR